ncbi:hypothetical protein Glove_52g163 [Diversispora epigaea]|uniref:Uncharacterized protein n=1 Tax=Diversispora epigaea TaxID=1348612 RepID=A0A397JP69_9GLOM|nr:hypothetical protein Glove_52g163 [Diversispora epigaea]
MVQNLKDYIITTRKKSGSSNKLCYCKACYNKYGENDPELKAIVDKTDRILSHFRNCSNFDEAYNQEEKKIIFSLASKKKINLGKRSVNNLSNNNNQPAKIQRNTSFSSQASSSSAQASSSSAQASSSSAQASLFSAQASSSSTQALSLLNYGPLDNFITRPLSSIDRKKFNLLILRVTISCGFALSWVNNPEVIELFKFLNPLIKLPDRKTLSDKILHEAVTDLNNTMIEKLESDRIGITLSFDGWINVREQELMGTIIMSSDGQPYVWKAMDISGERHKTDDYTRVLDMAKLRADITYNRRFYKESIISNIINSTLETQTQDNNLETETQEVNSETETQDINQEIDMQDVNSETESLIEENEEVSNNSEDDENNNIDIEDISQKFNDHLSEWMGILETETENSEFLENEIENIDHPAVNIQAKWNLDIIFKDNLPCPFD